jgi:hypothetical protein
LYILVRTVSAGCIAAQTHTPDRALAERYVQKELSLQPCLINIDLPRLYDGNCTDDPFDHVRYSLANTKNNRLTMAVRKSAEFTPRHKPRIPSERKIVRKASKELL